MRKKKTKYNIKPFLIIAMILISGTIFSSFKLSGSKSSNTATVASSQTTVYPTLYSDKHITKNAIVTDPKLKNTVVLNREKLTANVSNFVKKSGLYIYSAKEEKGTWLWTPTLNIDENYQNKIISWAKKNGIKNIYLSIDSYLDIYTMENGPEKDAKKKLFDQTIERFVKEADENDITVDAEGGWRNWAEEGNIYKAFAVMDYAMDYNKTHDKKFRGLQYDIEPYLLDEYQKNKSGVLKNFVSLVDESLVKLENSDLEFSVVIPEFYDGSNGETPRFFYGGKLRYTYDHLLSVLENRPGSKIIVMSYRNFSQGKDGSIEISQDEISRANKYQTKIVLAEETGNVEPAFVTFHNTSRAKYEKETALLEKAFEKESSYKGLAVHYINAFMDLK